MKEFHCDFEILNIFTCSRNEQSTLATANKKGTKYHKTGYSRRPLSTWLLTRFVDLQSNKQKSIFLLYFLVVLLPQCPVAQLLAGHGPEEEVMVRCNATANITVNCVEPNHAALTAMVVVFSIFLFIMICTMTLPCAVQNRIFHFCTQRAMFSYIDVGLYKTRHSMYRKEVFVRHVWGDKSHPNGSKRHSTVSARKKSAVFLEEPCRRPSTVSIKINDKLVLNGEDDIEECIPLDISPHYCHKNERRVSGTLDRSQTSNSPSSSSYSRTPNINTSSNMPADSINRYCCYTSDPNIRMSRPFPFIKSKSQDSSNKASRNSPENLAFI